MADELNERVEMIRQIKAEDLQAGGFVFQLPEGTSEEEKAAFEQTVKTAQEKNLNLTLTPDVKVVDTRAKPKGDPVEIKVATEEKTEEAPVANEKPVEQAVDEQPQPSPTPVIPQAQPMQPAFVQPQQTYQQGQIPWNYDPFTGMPIRPNIQQPVQQPPQQVQQQPEYNPQPAQPVQQPQQAGAVPPMPYSGFYYPQNQQQTQQQNKQ